MDPLSALIGGGMSLLGGYMSSTSAQAINAQNIANQQQMAQGAFLPGLISNAQKAGINPLAVIGAHTPSAGMAVPTDPGAGLRGAGQMVAQTSLHQLNMQQLAEEHGRLDVEALAAGIKNQNIQAATAWEAYKRLQANPSLTPAGFQYPPQETATGLPQAQWLGNLVGKNWSTFDLRNIFGSPPGPPWIDRGFK